MAKKLKIFKIDATTKSGSPMRYYDLNKRIRDFLKKGPDEIHLTNVRGQRFIGAGITSDVKIRIDGVPGNDLGVFMNGPEIEVMGNAEDHTGNTMESGRIIIHGNAWDVTGLAARGGEIFVRGNGGYRIGIHMKEYGDQHPTIIYGGQVRQFFGEYMAGGILVALGMRITDQGFVEDIPAKEVVQSHIGSGIHGGSIYIRGEVPSRYLGVGAIQKEFTHEDKSRLQPFLESFSKRFKLDPGCIWDREFVKITPSSSRPFGSYYTYSQI
ncbi:MAG: GltB/FmdC/FwdC-like GXGXG domain-containing protein [Candidatus Ranarchaeia archaeon]|jgi:glutamate synthase domain-containing protein 3